MNVTDFYSLILLYFGPILKSIELIAAVKHRDLQEYGFNAVLKPFIEDMNSLSQVGSL